MFKVKVTVVKVDDSQSEPRALIKLNINDNLSKVRTELENNSIVSMDNTLKFGRNKKSGIARENEENFLLNEIIETDQNQNFLYLIKDSKPSWRSLNRLHYLEYGYITVNDEIKRVNKKAFTMDGCELNLINDFCEEEVRCNSNKDHLMKKKLFFNDPELVKLGKLGFGNSKQESNDEINLYYKVNDHRKLSLKFRDYLKPTAEFINEVKAAIQSENLEQITEKFGKFIPTEIILGGRICSEVYSKSTKEFAEAEIGNTYKNVETNLRSSDHKAWIKSLDDYKMWECIEFRNIISIFILLPSDLREQMIRLIGKMILYSKTVDFKYTLIDRSHAQRIVELTELFSDISKILQSEADCNIFTTVMDSEDSKYKNDFFTCQVYHPTSGKPKLIIHCTQPKFKKRNCKLIIRIMIIGYDTDLILNSNSQPQLKILEEKFDGSKKQQSMFRTTVFKYDSLSGTFPFFIGIPILHELSNFSFIIGHNFFDTRKENKIGACTFSYCLKNKHYVNLPSFTFYTLIISEYPDPNAFGTMSFEPSTFSQKPCINFGKNSTKFKPKFISSFLMDESNYNPIFLKQKIHQIKIKYLNCRKSDCDICRKNTLKISHENIKCLFFDPQEK